MSEFNPDFSRLTIREFLAAANSSEPVPGGGSAAALAGALASSMGQMVMNLTIGKEKYKQFEPECKAVLASLEKAQAMMLELIKEDIAAFSEFTEARKLDKSDPQRPDKMAQAIQTCIAVPMEISAVALAMLDNMDSIKEKSNSFLLSDLGVGAELAGATVNCALFNVKANLSSVKGDGEKDKIRAQIQHDLQKAEKSLASIRDFLNTKF
jgi:formiminotetrahydrofolate cyclodeaminase